MDKKEQWANSVLNSLDGIQKAEPSVDLFDRITQKLPPKKLANIVPSIVPLRRLVQIAAVACLIVAVNVYAFSIDVKNKNENFYSSANNTTLLTSYSIYD